MMRTIIAVAGCMFTAACGAQEKSMHEASMNFDLENVQPFLAQLNTNLDLGLPVADLVDFTRTTAVENERSKTVTVTFASAKIKLEYRVFMDDIDAPDLYFIAESKDLADAIQAEFVRFADERGM